MTHWVNPDLKVLSIIVSPNGLVHKTVGNQDKLYPGCVHVVRTVQGLKKVCFKTLGFIFECVEPLNIFGWLHQ